MSTNMSTVSMKRQLRRIVAFACFVNRLTAEKAVAFMDAAVQGSRIALPSTSDREVFSTIRRIFSYPGMGEDVELSAGLIVVHALPQPLPDLRRVAIELELVTEFSGATVQGRRICSYFRGVNLQGLNLSQVYIEGSHDLVADVRGCTLTNSVFVCALDLRRSTFDGGHFEYLFSRLPKLHEPAPHGNFGFLLHPSCPTSILYNAVTMAEEQVGGPIWQALLCAPALPAEDAARLAEGVPTYLLNETLELQDLRPDVRAILISQRRRQAEGDWGHLPSAPGAVSMEPIAYQGGELPPPCGVQVTEFYMTDTADGLPIDQIPRDAFAWLSWPLPHKTNGTRRAGVVAIRLYIKPDRSLDTRIVYWVLGRENNPITIAWKIADPQVVFGPILNDLLAHEVAQMRQAFQDMIARHRQQEAKMEAEIHSLNAFLRRG